MLNRVADSLKVHIETLVGKGPTGLSELETDLVEGWRLLDGDGQRLVMELVRWGGRGLERPKAAAKRTVTPPSQGAPR